VSEVESLPLDEGVSRLIVTMRENDNVSENFENERALETLLVMERDPREGVGVDDRLCEDTEVGVGVTVPLIDPA
jgi:hypothetical protein